MASLHQADSRLVPHDEASLAKLLTARTSLVHTAAHSVLLPNAYAAFADLDSQRDMGIHFTEAMQHKPNVFIAVQLAKSNGTLPELDGRSGDSTYRLYLDDEDALCDPE